MDRKILDTLLHLRDGNCPNCGETLEYYDGYYSCPICLKRWNYWATKAEIAEYKNELDQL